MITRNCCAGDREILKEDMEMAKYLYNEEAVANLLP
jgi:hypothetical protein